MTYAITTYVAAAIQIAGIAHIHGGIRSGTRDDTGQNQSAQNGRGFDLRDPSADQRYSSQRVHGLHSGPG
jgi:hypothetical protein